MLVVAVVCLVFSLTALGFCLINQRLFQTIELRPQCDTDGVSILIPVRNEEEGIEETIQAILRSTFTRFQIVILNDGSTDRTADIVQKLADRHPEIHLHDSEPLPEGWCGKQFACHQLAKLASFERLLFLDADVRLFPEGLASLLAAFEECPSPLLSAVPAQQVKSLGERLLIPLIHYILLCYLPMWVMKRSNRPSASAGCGQLFLTTRTSYQASGGHAAIRGSLHDGVMLPRQYREQGMHTDIADGAQIATVRMYEGFAATWRGLSKNATEGVANRRLIVPVTALMLGAHVLPAILLALSSVLSLSVMEIIILVTAVVASLATRFITAWRFDGCWEAVPLHPIAIGLFLAIQWWAFVRSCLGLTSEWRGRSYQ